MKEALFAQFTWSHDHCVDPDEATVGKLRLFVDGALVWGKLTGVDWVWRDLLVHLASNWSRLLYEGWTEPVGGRRIAEAQRDYEAALALLEAGSELDQDDVIERESALYQWEQDHNLARALPGLTVPDVHVWADPAGVLVETRHGRREFARPDVEASLARIGDEIAARMASQGFASDEAVVAWRARAPAPSDQLAAGATGFAAGTLAVARSEFTEADAWGDVSGRMASTSWLEAARACSKYGSGALKAFFSAVGTAPPPTSRWDDLADALVPGPGTGIGEGQAARDAEVTRLVRDAAGLGPHEPIRLEDLAYHVGIELLSADLESTALAALVVFGLDHAPVVVTNQRACGLSREPLRRMAVARAVSLLADAAREGRPAAWAVTTAELEAGEDRRAVRLVLPAEAVEEYAAADSSPGLIDRLTTRFGVQPRIAALVLLESVAWAGTADPDKWHAAALAEGRGSLPPARPDLRVVG